MEKDMVAGSTQAVDSAPIKANASMESLVLKQGAASAEYRLQKAGTEHQDVNKEANPSSGQYITAPDHQLKRLERRQQRLNERPTGAIGSTNEKAQLLSNSGALLPARSRCPHFC
ncbi:hypothetical protein [Pontibacter korlensis]|uniref:hypothetical protein n=1 Tax=Pontibacter korlensis TaxID=400092 RepID=UPI001F2726A5|nr:hypothetical protein [Pontibacter korlensis]